MSRMSDRNPAISWRAVVYGVAIVYGTTFVSGLVFTFAGITPQMHHVAYPLLALYTSAVGVALALRVADTTRPSYLVAIGGRALALSHKCPVPGRAPYDPFLNSVLAVCDAHRLPQQPP